MVFAKTEREWAERAARHLKAQLKRANVTYEILAEMMKEHGFNETKASISNKLARATVPASFFLACLGGNRMRERPFGRALVAAFLTAILVAISLRKKQYATSPNRPKEYRSQRR